MIRGVYLKTKRLTTRERVLMSLKRIDRPVTAKVLAAGLSVRLDSLSSLLKKMVTAQQLEVVPGIGPRKGTGYKLSKRERVANIIKEDGGIGNGVRRMIRNDAAW